jgi:hypothetical protein
VSVCTPIDYTAHEVGGFVLAPLVLMGLSLPWGWWPFLAAALGWFACAFHMFTGWRPRPRKR